jgi:hypothetical protein
MTKIKYEIRSTKYETNIINKSEARISKSEMVRLTNHPEQRRRTNPNDKNKIRNSKHEIRNNINYRPMAQGTGRKVKKGKINHAYGVPGRPEPGGLSSEPLSSIKFSVEILNISDREYLRVASNTSSPINFPSSSISKFRPSSISIVRATYFSCNLT